MFSYSGVEIPFLSRAELFHPFPYFVKIGNTPARWCEPVAWNVQFFFGEASIREGYFSCGLKSEHTLLLRSFDSFEIAYPGSLVSKVFQVGSVKEFFLIL